MTNAITCPSTHFTVTPARCGSITDFGVCSCLLRRIIFVSDVDEDMNVVEEEVVEDVGVDVVGMDGIAAAED